ncbi:MAG: DNA-3-methyladenine glycosylase, partial [Actinomycetota bacterium]
GRLYVYFTYGMHWCMNVVTGGAGEGSAVLLRAAEPLGGAERMVALRGTDRIRDLCRGPARLAQAFDVDGDFDGVDLVRGSPVWIEQAEPLAVGSIRAGPRVGVAKGADRPWRFWEEGSPWVSSWRPGRAATRSVPRASRR